MNLQHKLKVAISRALIDKNPPHDAEAYVTSFENVEITARELIGYVCYGFALCAQLAGRRRTANFLCSDIACVDVDNGMRLEAALAHPFVQAHALFIYTTVSHTEEHHHFRIVFALPYAITDGAQFGALMRSLSLRLCGDPAATDSARIFFGCSTAIVHIIGNQITEELVAELIAQSARLPERESDSKAGHSAPARSALSIAPEALIRLADGRFVPLADTTPRSRAYCPFHNDQNPSAFVVQSRHGVHGLHCHTCRTTYWPRGHDRYDFTSFERQAREVRRFYNETFDPGPLFDMPERMRGLHDCTIILARDQPVPPKLQPGVMFVKSPKGSGKTEGVARLVRSARRVLLIGHRRALIRESCKRLGLNCYLDERSWQSSFGVCLDSLPILDLTDGGGRYDAVIIDESEQVLSHLLSDTLDGRREALFARLRHLVFSAKSVIALDADLGWASFNTISRMRNFRVGEGGNELPSSSGHAILHLNDQPFAVQRSIEIYEADSHLVSTLKQAIADGERCFVTSNSKSRVTKLSHAIAETFPDKRLILITSDTINEHHVQAFVSDAKREARTYDVILTSPSLGTGVDITFPHDEQLVDVVVGFCDPLITTHFDFDQQLARVRHPKRVKVWVTPLRFHFETNEDVVRADILQHSLYKTLLVGFHDDGQPIYLTEDAFIDMAAMIVSQQRASKNNLKDHFVEHKRAQGYDITHVAADAALLPDGVLFQARGKALDEAAYRSSVLGSVSLQRRTFTEVRKRLEAGEAVAREERERFVRTSLERFYRQPASADLLELDDRGRYRRKVIMFTLVTTVPEWWLKTVVRGEVLPTKMRFVKTKEEQAFGIFQALRLTPLLLPVQSGHSGVRAAIEEALLTAFNPDAVLTAGDLYGFAEFVLKNKSAIQNLLDIQIRSDVRENPVRQLNAFLAVLGMRLLKVSTAAHAGKKIVSYRLDQSALAMMLGIVAARAAEEPSAALARVYGWQENPPEDGEDGDQEQV